MFRTTKYPHIDGLAASSESKSDVSRRKQEKKRKQSNTMNGLGFIGVVVGISVE